jgi:hypothetical protein
MAATIGLAGVGIEGGTDAVDIVGITVRFFKTINFS